MSDQRARGSAVERALVAVLVAAACAACSVEVPTTDAPGFVSTPTASAPSDQSSSDGSAPAPSVSSPSTRQPSPTRPSARPGSALAALSTLTVKGRAPMTGYSRAQFGGRWPDVDRNGCDTRNDVLRRDLTAIRFRGSSDCVVASGRLLDPYTGDVIDFVRGAATSSEVQIDHVVALGDAWQKGAARWTPDKRVRFANDPLNLLAVGGAVNQAKGDGDAATWLPPRTAYRCAYVARQIAVKATYGVSVTAAEREAMARVLSRCPAQPLPTR
ncbi:MAG TPA: HNH endonuclease family protein [Candidatus Nanopelagicales bacterium]|nr:HNH endonuclease family protein [Candidatus Nanopelagicales bacterium]